MRYLIFSLGFTLIHMFSYTLAGAIILKYSKDTYNGKSRIMTYLRDMSSDNESKHVQKFFLPAQFMRGILMSIALYPILGVVGELGFFAKLVFSFSLMFVFTHIASAAPCPDNLEGFVYLKEEFFSKKTFLKFQIEMIMYSSVFAILATLFIM